MCLLLVFNFKMVNPLGKPATLFFEFIILITASRHLRLKSQNNDSDDYLKSILIFQTQYSDAGHVVFIIDDTFKDTLTLTETTFSLGIGTTLIVYNEEVKLNIYLETIYNNRNPRIDFILLCSSQTILQIFQEVNDNRLETGFFRWIIIIEKLNLNELTNYLYDENQVTVFEGKHEQNSRIAIREMFRTENNQSFQNIGWLTFSENSQNIKITKRREPLFPSIIQSYQDFRGRKLKVAANENQFVFFHQRILENGTALYWEGVDVNIISELARIHNFTFEVVHPIDGRWGGPTSDGNITGLIGLIAKHEADVAIHEITITASRASVIDFTVPYYSERSTIVSKTPELSNSKFVLLSPYSFLVWMMIIGSLVLTSFFAMLIDLLYLKNLKKPNESFKNSEKRNNMHKFTVKENFSLYCFNMFRTLVAQDNKIESKCLESKGILGLWFFSCIVFSATYSAGLFAEFAAPTYQRPINSLYDLLKACSKGSVYPITTPDTALADSFKQATSGTNMEIYKCFDPDKSYVDYDFRYSETAKGKAVILSSEISNIIKCNIYGRDKYHIGNEPFFYQFYGIAVAKESPFQEVFNTALQRIIEAGLIKKWVQESLANDLQERGIAQRDKGNILCRMNRENQPINIMQIQTAFYLHAVGVTLAFLAFITEYFVNFSNNVIK